jgi:hypothetical protein
MSRTDQQTNKSNILYSYDLEEALITYEKLKHYELPFETDHESKHNYFRFLILKKVLNDNTCQIIEPTTEIYDCWNTHISKHIDDYIQMCNIIKFVISCNTSNEDRDEGKVKRFKEEMMKYFHINIKDEINKYEKFINKNNIIKRDDKQINLFVKTVKQINLFVKTISGKTIILYINEFEDLTINEIKELIFKKEGVPVELMFLIYGCKILYDNKKMSDYKIVNNSTIHMNIRINKIL